MHRGLLPLDALEAHRRQRAQVRLPDFEPFEGPLLRGAVQALSGNLKRMVSVKWWTIIERSSGD